MSILLDILGVIGIILLILLGVIILLLLIILFVPIRYKIDAKSDGETYAKIRCSWLLSIFTFTARYYDEFDTVFNIFGISYEKYRWKKKVRSAEKSDEEVYSEENASKACQDKKSRGIITRVSRVINWGKNTYIKIKKMLRKPKIILQLVEEYKEILEKDETKATLELLVNQLSYLWQKIRPRKLECYVEYGASDNYTTGSVLGYRSMLYPIIGERVVFIPNFDEEIFRGNIKAKGRLYLVFVLCIVIKLYFNKGFMNTVELEGRARNRFKRRMNKANT